MLLLEVGRWQREHGADITIAVIAERIICDVRAQAAEHGLTDVLLQERRDVADAYHAHAVSSAVLVLPDGRISRYVAVGAGAIGLIVGRALDVPITSLASGSSSFGVGLPRETTEPPTRGILTSHHVASRRIPRARPISLPLGHRGCGS